jgi:hypothetical protein
VVADLENNWKRYTDVVTGKQIGLALAKDYEAYARVRDNETAPLITQVKQNFADLSAAEAADASAVGSSRRPAPPARAWPGHGRRPSSSAGCRPNSPTWSATSATEKPAVSYRCLSTGETAVRHSRDLSAVRSWGRTRRA